MHLALGLTAQFLRWSQVVGVNRGDNYNIRIIRCPGISLPFLHFIVCPHNGVNYL